ncbi:uncharacterized protein [Dermacentor andersoni]|uniref:uncharacterized protein n=1 Tax=Dermacentor andersoni TaxID=34620 RepID=UPI00241809D3|nr:amiloride-sensitive sodium channel subunit gamma-like [Dermacentor andersoni]
MTTRPRRVDALLAQALHSSGARARGDDGKNESTGMQVLLRLRLMFAKSAIPGLRVILGLSHPMRRLAWTAALAALVCIGLNDLYVVFREYFEYADTVDVKWARSPEGMALPAVTFCNLNQVRKNVFCGDIELNRSTATEWQQRICGGNSILPIWSIYFRLEPPYRNPCQRDFPEKYRDHISPDRVYTRKACRHICAQLRVIAACGCQSHDYDTVDRSLAEICNEDDEELNNCIAEVAEKIDGGQVECPCLESCTMVEYSWQASSLKWTKNILEEQAGYERNGRSRKELTEVVVYLASAQGYRRKNDPKVTVPRLVSSMGSIMGMYVGMSFLLIFNVFDIIARALIASYRKFQRAQECRVTLQGIPWNPNHHLPGYKFFSNWRGIAPYLNKAAGHH